MQSLNNSMITVFGGGGFLGRYVCEALLSCGARIRVAQRSIAGANIIKPLGNLGQVEIIAADVRKPGSIARAVAGADMVVNLVGSFSDLDAVQHIGAANIAKAAKLAGVKALVHISAIGGDSDSPAKYGQSKAAGEAAVRAAFPKATILRPSIVFGREDQFVNRFAALIRMLPIVPVIGAETKFQPVFVGDVAKAVQATLVDSAMFAGKSFDLGGPQILTMLELNQWIASAIGREKWFVPVPNFAASILAKTTGWLPFAPITSDQLLMLASDNVVAKGKDGLAAMGITPTPLEAVSHEWLTLYRKHGRFGEKAVA
jgi:uncharacterized protein YbjT (DUF2867 family)